jgi:hypothetical protein
LADWVTLLSGWSKALNLSLRIQEQILAQANFIVRGYNTNNWFIHNLILISLCIRARSPKLFDLMSTGTLEPKLLQSEVEQLCDIKASDDSLDDALGYGVMILLAGFVSPEAIKAAHNILAERPKPSDSRELRSLERQIRTLEKAFGIVDAHTYHRLPGPGVVRRIRFLTE